MGHVAVPLELLDRLTKIMRRELLELGDPGAAVYEDGATLLSAYLDALEQPTATVKIRLPSIDVANRLLARVRRNLLALAVAVPQDATPGKLIELWLNYEPKQPAFPSAEPGDLLVKIPRLATDAVAGSSGYISESTPSEVWTFTVHGWQKLQHPDPPRQQAAGAVVREHIDARMQEPSGVSTGRAELIAGAETIGAVKMRRKLADALKARQDEYRDAADAIERVHFGNKMGHVRELEQRRRGIAEARHIIDTTDVT